MGSLQFVKCNSTNTLLGEFEDKGLLVKIEDWSEDANLLSYPEQCAQAQEQICRNINNFPAQVQVHAYTFFNLARQDVISKTIRMEGGDIDVEVFVSDIEKTSRFEEFVDVKKGKGSRDSLSYYQFVQITEWMLNQDNAKSLFKQYRDTVEHELGLYKAHDSYGFVTVEKPVLSTIHLSNGNYYKGVFESISSAKEAIESTIETISHDILYSLGFRLYTDKALG